jgi:DNA-directed RNA polymerase subunit RPC12/RpoP
MEQHNINLSLDKTTPIQCKECNNEAFIEGIMLRKASKFLIGSSQDTLIPISIMICSKCGTPVEETIPIQLKNKE